MFSNSIEYKIDESKIKLIDNHFIINNSNAIIIKDDLINDGNRGQDEEMIRKRVHSDLNMLIKGNLLTKED